MKAHLLDPFACTFSTVEYNGDWRTIKNHIGNECTLFTTVQINSMGDVMYVDDEGMFNSPSHLIHHWESDNLFYGRGLVLGTNDEGDSIEPSATLDSLRSQFRFARLLR